MRHRKHGYGLLFVSLLAISGLGAFGVTVADAALPGESTPGKYKILGLDTLVGVETFGGAQEGAGILLVAKLGIDLKCAAGDVTIGNFRGNPEEALVSVLFLGCKVFEHKTAKEITGCKIPGEMLTATAIFFPELHGGELFVLGEPDGSAAFTTVTFEKGKECVLTLNNEIKGTVTAQAPAGEVVEPLVTFSEAIQKLTGDKLLFGANEAFVNGSGQVHLTGVHVNCKFGVV